MVIGAAASGGRGIGNAMPAGGGEMSMFAGASTGAGGGGGSSGDDSAGTTLGRGGGVRRADGFPPIVVSS